MLQDITNMPQRKKAGPKKPARESDDGWKKLAIPDHHQEGIPPV